MLWFKKTFGHFHIMAVYINFQRMADLLVENRCHCQPQYLDVHGEEGSQQGWYLVRMTDWMSWLSSVYQKTNKLTFLVGKPLPMLASAVTPWILMSMERRVARVLAIWCRTLLNWWSQWDLNGHAYRYRVPYAKKHLLIWI